MMSDRDLLMQFIKRYHELPCLWRTKDRDYHSKDIRNLALDKLVQVLKKTDKAATRDCVLKKINNIRGTFRKELHKVRASEESGARAVYVPKLWYFNNLLFLCDQDQEPTRKSVPSIFDELSDAEDDEFEADGDDMHESDGSHPSSTPQRSAKKSRLTVKAEQILDPIDPFSDVVQKSADDCHNVFGMYLAAKLREMPKDVEVLCRRLINEAIYMGESSQLTPKTRITH